MNRKQSNVGFLVDVAYLYAAKERLGGNIDYAALRKRIEEYVGSPVTHGCAFMKGIPNQGKFLHSLRSAGYRYVFCHDPTDSPHWSSQFAEQILAMVPYVSSMVIASADPKLAGILDYVVDTWNTKITLVGFNGDLGELGDASDARLYLDERIIYVRQPAEVQQ